MFEMYYTVSLLILICAGFSSGDIPCNKIKSEAGYICACNSTYCDTINPPKPLPTGKFHFYHTSAENPGFNYETGHFKMQAFPPYGFVYKVNSTKTYQNVRGFGGSFSDSFGAVHNSLSTNAQENLMKSFFSEEGLEYSMCRVVLGSSDFTVRNYTYLPHYDPSMKSFNLTEDDFIYKIDLIKKALSMTKREINLIGSTWTAPSWMKKNNDSIAGYIKDEFRQLWADYHIKALDAYKAEGVNFWGLTTGNEPITLFMVKFYPAVVMFPEEQREWIINSLGPALEKSQHKTKLILLDDFRIYATWWMNTIMKEPKARKYIDAIGLHWYADVMISPKMLDEIHEKYPRQEIMYTESSINVGFKASLNENGEVTMIIPEINNHKLQRPILGSWERAGYYASNIIENLNHWVTLYIDWNLALDLQGGPVTTDGHCDASVIVNNVTDEFYKQPIYYVMGHFSKFMLPGSVIIDVHSNNDYANRQHLLKNNIMSDEAKTTTQRPRPTRPVDMHVQHAAVLNPDGSHTLTFYNPKSHGVEIAVHDSVRGYAFLVLEANSINTIIYW